MYAHFKVNGEHRIIELETKSLEEFNQEAFKDEVFDELGWRIEGVVLLEGYKGQPKDV